MDGAKTSRITLNRLEVVALVMITAALLAGCGPLPSLRQQVRITEMAPVPLDPDREADALPYEDLERKLGAVPRPRRAYHIGVVLKFLGNPYWQHYADGVHERAEALGMTTDIRAGATETDPAGQRRIMEAMMESPYDAFIVAPQTDENLSALVVELQRKATPVLIVNEVITVAQHWVGPNQYRSGALAAGYLVNNLEEGDSMAIIKGLPEAYAARRRTLGFREELRGSGLQIVATVPCDWNAQKALAAAATLLEAYPDLRAFYCNNDVMAMGVLEAVTDAGRTGEVLVIGTDGIPRAREAIRLGTMAATVDSSPKTTGEISIEIITRILAGQNVPRVVYTPQQVIALGIPEQPAP